MYENNSGIYIKSDGTYSYHWNFRRLNVSAVTFWTGFNWLLGRH